MSILAVLATIFISGVAGGIGGAFMGDEFISKEKDKDGNLVIRNQKNVVILDWSTFFNRVVLGVLAAFVVPLFLVLAAPGQEQSIIKQLVTQACPDGFQAFQNAAAELNQVARTEEAITEAIESATKTLENAAKDLKEAAGNCTKDNDWWNNLLILIGFCIVAALVAQRFLGTIADKLLKEAKEEASDALQSAKVARAESQVVRDAVRKLGPSQDLDDTAKEVLKAFIRVPDIPASAQGIASLVSIGTDEVTEALEDMKDGGLIAQDKKGDQEFDAWRLRAWGKMRLRQEIGLSEDDVRLLDGIKSSPNRRPTATDLVAQSGLTQSATDQALKRTERFGLVAESGSEAGGWRMKSWGKVALEESRNK